MAYLRKLVGYRRASAHRLSCPSCLGNLYRFERFCPACGDPNQRFSEDVFVRFAQASIEKVALTCVDDPSHEIEQLLDEDSPSSFCTICGARLVHDDRFDDF